MAAGQVHHARLSLAAGRTLEGLLQQPRGDGRHLGRRQECLSLHLLTLPPVHLLPKHRLPPKHLLLLARTRTAAAQLLVKSSVAAEEAAACPVMACPVVCLRPHAVRVEVRAGAVACLMSLTTGTIDHRKEVRLTW